MNHSEVGLRIVFEGSKSAKLFTDELAKTIKASGLKTDVFVSALG